MSGLLLDTHALLWWFGDMAKLSPKARQALSDAEQVIYVSSVSGWEIATKHRIGKLDDPRFAGLIARFPQHISSAGFIPLAVDMEDGLLAGNLDIPHRDPFDRMLFAQALRRDLGLVSIDGIADQAGCRRIW